MFEWLLVGYIILWGWEHSSARPLQWLWDRFGQCRFCAGVWVYFCLTPLFTPRPFVSLYYVPVLYELASALVASFLMFWFTKGLDSDKVIHYG